MQVSGQANIVEMIKRWFISSPDIQLNLSGKTYDSYNEITKGFIIHSQYTSTFTNKLDYILAVLKAYMSDYADCIQHYENTQKFQNSQEVCENNDNHNNTTTNTSNDIIENNMVKLFADNHITNISNENSAVFTKLKEQKSAQSALELLLRDHFSSFIDLPDDLFSLMEPPMINTNSSANKNNTTAHNNTTTTHNTDNSKSQTDNINTTVELPLLYTKLLTYNYTGLLSIHLNADNKIEKFEFLFKLKNIERATEKKSPF